MKTVSVTEYTIEVSFECFTQTDGKSGSKSHVKMLFLILQELVKLKIYVILF
jgi:hypothetical protein